MASPVTVADLDRMVEQLAAELVVNWPINREQVLLGLLTVARAVRDLTAAAQETPAAEPAPEEEPAGASPAGALALPPFAPASAGE